MLSESIPVERKYLRNSALSVLNCGQMQMITRAWRTIIECRQEALSSFWRINTPVAAAFVTFCGSRVMGCQNWRGGLSLAGKWPWDSLYIITSGSFSRHMPFSAWYRCGHRCGIGLPSCDTWFPFQILQRMTYITIWVWAYAFWSPPGEAMSSFTRTLISKSNFNSII